MKINAKNIIIKLLLAFSVLGLQACSSVTPQSNLVAQAYETTGIIEMPHYNRTIFNQNNF